MSSFVEGVAKGAKGFVHNSNDNRAGAYDDRLRGREYIEAVGGSPAQTREAVRNNNAAAQTIWVDVGNGMQLANFGEYLNAVKAGAVRGPAQSGSGPVQAVAGTWRGSPGPASAPNRNPGGPVYTTNPGRSPAPGQAASGGKSRPTGTSQVGWNWLGGVGSFLSGFGGNFQIGQDKATPIIPIYAGGHELVGDRGWSSAGDFEDTYGEFGADVYGVIKFGNDVIRNAGTNAGNAWRDPYGGIQQANDWYEESGFKPTPSESRMDSPNWQPAIDYRWNVDSGRDSAWSRPGQVGGGF